MPISLFNIFIFVVIYKHLQVFIVKEHLVTTLQAMDSAPLSHSAQSGLFRVRSSSHSSDWLAVF